MKTVSISSVLLVACLAVSTTSTASAQNSSRDQLAITQQRRAAATSPFTVLTQPPSNLPYMAQVSPPGGQFVSGMKDNRNKGRMTLLLRYGFNGSAADMIRYYADSLRQARWKVSNVTNESLLATQKGNTCSLSIYPPSRKGFQNDLQITYQLPANE